MDTLITQYSSPTCTFLLGVVITLAIQLLIRAISGNESYDPRNPNDRNRVSYLGTKNFAYDTHKLPWKSIPTDYTSADDKNNCDTDRFEGNESYDVSNKSSPANLASRIVSGFYHKYGAQPFDLKGESYGFFEEDLPALLSGHLNL